jgi:hypothetical protein
MKNFLILICCITGLKAHAQAKDTMRIVTTTGIFDTAAYKSGYRINDYYVELNKEDVKKYKGKKVKVSGKLLVLPGLDPADKEIKQGSASERKFITWPTIEIISSRENKK